MTTRKSRGAETARLVAASWREIYPWVETVGAGISGRDLTGTPGVAIEVKARRGLDLGAWMRQATRQATEGEVPVLVIRLDGQGPVTVDDWPALTTQRWMRRILREAGYGDQIPGRSR